jgi:hypothetical protein
MSWTCAACLHSNAAPPPCAACGALDARGAALRGAATPGAPVDALAPVAIDLDGVFKYVLVRAELGGGAAPRLLVRGFCAAAYHDDVFQHHLPAILAAPGVARAECAGGGRIAADARAKTLRIYGYSKGYGRGDHAAAAALVRVALPGWAVRWDNEGY